MRSDLRIVQSGPDAFVVVDPATGKAFRFGSEERYLLHLFDGGRQPADVKEAFERHAERPISRRHVEEFLEQLRVLGLLEAPASAKRAAAVPARPAPTREDAAARELKVRRLNRRFDLLVQAFGWLIHPIWVPPIVLLAAIALTGLARQAPEFLTDMGAFLDRLPLPGFLFKLVLIFITITFLRSLAFGIAARKAGATLKRFDLGFLHSLIPYVHCEIARFGANLPKRDLARMVWVRFCTKLAFTALAVTGWLMAPPGTSRSTIFLVASYHFMIGLFFQLIPFQRTDAYAVIALKTRRPDLFERAWAETRAWLLWRRSPQALTDGERFWFRVFGMGTLLSNLFLYAVLMGGGAYLLIQRYGGPGALLALIGSVWWFLRPFERWRSAAQG